MIKIFICEDEEVQRNTLCSIIENHIMINECEMELACATAFPRELIQGVKAEFSGGKSLFTGLYFLDLDLKSDLNGFDLAKKIREIDPRGFIVIVTTHSELLPLTFQYMIEPLDYIIKDDTLPLAERIIRCLNKADQRYQRFLSENRTDSTVSFKVGQKQFHLYADEITHITLSEEAHKLKIHCTNKIIQVRATLSSIEGQLPDSFFRISREVLINTHYVQEINLENGIVILSGDISYQVSIRKIAELKKRCRKN